MLNVPKQYALPDIFFFTSLGFVSGTALGALSFSPLLILIGSGIAIVVLFFFSIRPALLISVCIGIILGNLYYAFDDYQYERERNSLHHVTIFTGTVIRVPRERSNGQSVLVSLDGNRGRIILYTEGYPRLAYGDTVEAEGSLVPPPADSYGNYLGKEGVAGSIFGPTITVMGNNGNPILTVLFGLREYIRSTLAILFPHETYALVAAILIGDRDAFSDNFMQKLSVSGTLHITALSGGHITIIVVTLCSMVSALARGRPLLTWSITFMAVAFFVAMTGFVVSAIRAALMAALATIARNYRHTQNPKNVILFAALLITLWNPKSIMFDVGFQLSFAATIAIIYLVPVFERLRFFSTPGICGWRTVLAVTLAAQLGVFPITVWLFENFSWSSLPANIAIVALMPLITIGGFVAVIGASVWTPLGVLIAKPLQFLLIYTEEIIDFFAFAAVPFNPAFGMVSTCAYYAILWWIIRIWGGNLLRTKEM